MDPNLFTMLSETSDLYYHFSPSGPGKGTDTVPL